MRPRGEDRKETWGERIEPKGDFGKQAFNVPPTGESDLQTGEGDLHNAPGESDSVGKPESEVRISSRALAGRM